MSEPRFPTLEEHRAQRRIAESANVELDLAQWLRDTATPSPEDHPRFDYDAWRRSVNPTDVEWDEAHPGRARCEANTAMENWHGRSRCLNSATVDQWCRIHHPGLVEQRRRDYARRAEKNRRRRQTREQMRVIAQMNQARPLPFTQVAELKLYFDLFPDFLESK